MQPLTAEEVLQLWERGENRRPAERAFALLARARAGVPAERLAAMTVGESESALLELRIATYGPQLQAVDTCPACTTTVELAIDATALIAATDDTTSVASSDGGAGRQIERKPIDVSIDGWQLQLAAPTVGDLLALSGETDGERARDVLLERCVRAACSPDGAASSALDLPGYVRVRLAEVIEHEDAAAQLTTRLECPDCKHAWDALLDVGAYLWREIASSARRLLREALEKQAGPVLTHAFPFDGWRCERTTNKVLERLGLTV